MKKKQSVKEKCQRALMLKKGLEGYKEDYAELDELTLELKDEPELAAHGLMVIDNFAEKNVQWGHGSVRRFELKIVAAPKAKAAVAVESQNKAAANGPATTEPKPRARGKA
jgi:hypothetical protein